MLSFLTAVDRRTRDASSRPLLRCLVTTGNDRDVSAAPRSVQLADVLNRHGGVAALWVSRFETSVRPTTLVKMLEEHGADAVLVVDGSGTLLRLGTGAEFRLHGGLGVLRVRNALRGGSDALVAVCGLREGDVFVDATAGQLQDSLAAAAAVGSTGRVIAIEASALLWAVTSGRPVMTGVDDVDRMLNERIEVRLGEALAVLAAMPSATADVSAQRTSLNRTLVTAHAVSPVHRRAPFPGRLFRSNVGQASQGELFFRGAS